MTHTILGCFRDRTQPDPEPQVLSIEGVATSDSPRDAYEVQGLTLHVVLKNNLPCATYDALRRRMMADLADPRQWHVLDHVRLAASVLRDHFTPTNPD